MFVVNVVNQKRFIVVSSVLSLNVLLWLFSLQSLTLVMVFWGRLLSTPLEHVLVHIHHTPSFVALKLQASLQGCSLVHGLANSCSRFVLQTWLDKSNEDLQSSCTRRFQPTIGLIGVGSPNLKGFSSAQVLVGLMNCRPDYLIKYEHASPLIIEHWKRC